MRTLSFFLLFKYSKFTILLKAIIKFWYRIGPNRFKWATTANNENVSLLAAKFDACFPACAYE